MLHILVSRYLAEWMTYGYPTANVWPLDIKRFGNLQSSRTFLRHRVMEVMRKSPLVTAYSGVVIGNDRLKFKLNLPLKSK